MSRFVTTTGARTRWRLLAGDLGSGIVATAVAQGLVPLAPTSTPASPCPGLPELLVAAAARAFPASPVVVSLHWIDLASTTIAAALFIALARRASLGRWTALASAVVLAGLPAVVSAWVPLHGIGLAASAFVLFALGPRRDPNSRNAPPLLPVCLGIGLVAATAPGATIPLALAGAWLVRDSLRPNGDAGRPRTWYLAASVALLVGLPVVVAFGAASGADAGARGAAACLAGAGGAFHPGAVGRLISAASGGGAYAYALLAFGVVATWRRENRTAASRAASYAGALLVAGLLPAVDPLQMAPALAVAFWGLATVGLDETRRAARPTVGGRIAALILVLLVPGLPLAARLAHPSEPAETFGYRSASLDLWRSLVQPLPDNSAVVTGDALAHAMLGAATRSVHLVVPDPFALAVTATASSSSRMFVLPDAQQALAHSGFRLRPIAGGNPLVEVEGAESCRQIGDAWRVLSDLAPAPGISIVARRDDERGPVVVYAAFETEPVVVPRGWPDGTLRGFHATPYRRDVADDRARLTADLGSDGGDAAWVGEAPFVVRLEEWRTPGSPSTLATSFGAMPHVIAARLVRVEPDARLTLCPAFPIEPGRLTGLR